MRWANKLVLRLRSLLRRERIDHELDDEIQFHLEHQIEENMAAGMSTDERAMRRVVKSADWRRSERSAAMCAE